MNIHQKKDNTISDTDLMEDGYLIAENRDYYIVFNNRKASVSNTDELIDMGIPLRKEKQL